MARLLLINQSVGYLFNDIIAAAVTCGHQVTLMAGTVEGSLPPGVSWIKGFAYRRESGLSRLLSWLQFTLQLMLFLSLKGHQYDLLLVVSNPPVAPILAPLARRPYGLLLYDLYPQILNNMGYLSSSHWLYVMWQKLNQWTLERASSIFTLSSGMAAEILMDLPLGSITRQDIDVTPPWNNTQLVRSVPPSDNQFMSNAGLTGHFVVLYAGNMGLTHPLETLIEAARHLETHPQVQVLMVGDGAKRLALEHQAKELKNIRFLPFLSNKDFSECLFASSVVVIALDSKASSNSVPSKTYNALALGKPLLVLAGEQSEISRLVDSYQVGLRVDPNSPMAFAEAIRELISHPDQIKMFSQRSLLAARDFTPQLAQQLVNKWLTGLISKKP
jgi:glycosyltransferase involved in cell wall biosynthesis